MHIKKTKERHYIQIKITQKKKDVFKYSRNVTSPVREESEWTPLGLNYQVIKIETFNIYEFKILLLKKKIN